VLLVVCPNLAIDRILEVDHFQAAKVQRSRSVIVQPGGKGSNAARVFRQLGGEVVLVGFVGSTNSRLICEPLRRFGIHVDVVAAYPGDSRTCTIVCDKQSQVHPTVINEESSRIEDGAAARLLNKVHRWIPDVDGVLTTGSLSTGLPDDFYAEILDYARMRKKFTAMDAAGAVLRAGLSAYPSLIKPNMEEFFQLTRGPMTSGLLTFAPHTALTFGKTGAVLINAGKFLYAAPPRVFDTNPVGAGDAFVAAYLWQLLRGRNARECLRFAMAAAASDSATLRPGFLDISQFHSLIPQVELHYL